MADRIYASVINQKTVTQVQLQVLTIIAAQLGLAAQFDSDLLDL